jgi:phospholipase A2
LDVLTTPPLNKVRDFAISFCSRTGVFTSNFEQYLLSGLIRKATAPGTTASLVDIYGTLVSARLFVPTNIKDLDYRFLSAHQFRRFIDKGEMPLPIMTAVSRHLLEPLPKVEKDVKKGKEASVDENRTKILERELQGRAEWL